MNTKSPSLTENKIDVSLNTVIIPFKRKILHIETESEITNKKLKLSSHTNVEFSFGDCKICSEKASGVHYGIATCEGCKVKN